MEKLAFVLSILGLTCAIMPNLIKGKNLKLILFFLICCNLLYACSYLAEGKGINGSVAGFLGAVISAVNFTFESKGKPIPKWLLAVYLVVAVAIQLLIAGFTYLTVVILLAFFAFLMGALQPNGKMYRVWALANVLLWVLYDVLSKSYALLPVHCFQTVTVVVGMILHDRKKQNKKAV